MKTLIFSIRLFLRPFCDTLCFIWLVGFIIVYLSGCATTGKVLRNMGRGMQQQQARQLNCWSTTNVAGQIFTRCH